MKHFFLLLSLLLTSVTSVFADETEYVTIVDEDFSGLTEGTEENPCTESLLDANGYFKDPSVLKPYASDCTVAWGGDNVYSAGGCLAIRDGFINTPAGNYSGNLHISLRARLMDSDPQSSATIELLLCRRSKLIDFERVPITLTHEWQTYTLDTNTGSYADCTLQLYDPNTSSYLVDDIKISHQILNIQPPTATDPYDLEDDGFTANWKCTDDAVDYLLSVYSKTENPDAEHVSESFDNLNVAGTTITSGIPEGWTLNTSSVSTTSYGTAPYALLLSENGQTITTPYSEVPLKEFRFWARIDDNGQTDKATGFVNVYANTDYGWYLWTYFSVQGSRGAEGGMTDLSGVLGAFENVYQIRIEYENPNNDKCQVLIDDIEYYVPGTFTRNFVFEDRRISGNKTSKYKVTGLDPDTDYFYYVRSRNMRYTSDPSNEMEVYDVSNPTATSATDVTATSYVANWQCHNKVDEFHIEQVRQLVCNEDNPSYVVLSEDFSRVHSDGTVENPEPGAPSSQYHSIDDYTQTGGWTATSVQFAEGMMGGMEKEQGYIAGCIVTPQMDLSNNSGVADVAIRVWGNEGDWLVIQGNNTTNYAGINFPQTGWVETTVQMPLCTSAERLYFYSNNYLSFMIDYITITQSLKKGDVVNLVDKSASVPGTERSVKMDNVDLLSADMRYKVTAKRYYHGDTSDIWESPASDYVTVHYDAPSAIRPAAVTTGRLGRTYDLQGRPTTAQRGLQLQNRNGHYVKVLRK